MPRKARVIVPGYPHHIVQRGHNRNVVFVEDGDYQYYLDNLLEWKQELGLKVYSYCLMTNHIHLIVQASEDPGCLGKLMKRLAGRQTRFVNKQERRTGSLWESRYKVSPIENSNYLLQCCRYVELNPVKANMVITPGEYRWSSYLTVLGEILDPLVDINPAFLNLANSHNIRVERYKAFVSDFVCAAQQHDFLQRAVERNQLTGTQRFIDEVERRLGVRVECRSPGRPKLRLE